MIVRINRMQCNGCTICNITCPEVFRIDEDGKVSPWMHVVPRSLEEFCIEAVDECPAGAIHIAGFGQTDEPGLFRGSVSDAKHSHDGAWQGEEA